MRTELQRAWAAGFIDGEGCISVQVAERPGRSPQYQVLLDVAQSKRAPLDRLVEMFGGTVRIGGPSKDTYYWRLYSHKAGRVLEAVLPYLVLKHRQAELALEMITYVGSQGRTRSSVVLDRQSVIVAEFRQLNARRSRHAERLSESTPQDILRVMR